MRRWLRRAVDSSVDILFPPQCVWCEGEIDDRHPAAQVCAACQQAFLGSPARRCPRCWAEVRGPDDDDRPCGECRRRAAALDRVVGLGTYRDDLREAVLRMKARGAEAIALALADLLVDARRDALAAIDVEAVTAVPMHWRRRWQRGVNSAELLAGRVARRLGKPFLHGAIRCRRATRQQASLLPAGRRQNVRGAFRVSRAYDLASARVLVVDDVLTTGATCEEIARILRRAGVAQVSVAVAARAAAGIS